MNAEQIKNKLKSGEYDFLRNDPNFNSGIILLTTGGSHSYGTSIDTIEHTSDIDIRGIKKNSAHEILTMEYRDKPFENRLTDTVIYPFKQVINLLLNVNPNIIEILGTKEEHLFVCTEEGWLLRNNVDAFLSRKAAASFGGYAIQQLRRLQNSLARDKYGQDEKEGHILKSIEKQMLTIEDRYKILTGEELKLYIDNSDKEGYEKEIFMDANLKKYPLRDFKNIYSEISNVIKNYDTLNHRNSKKDETHLLKHAMHLVRLHLMYIEIATTKKVNTYREKDRQLLLDIRNGVYTYDEIFAIVNDLEKDVKYADNNTILPEKPDMERIYDIIKIINTKTINEK